MICFNGSYYLKFFKGSVPQFVLSLFASTLLWSFVMKKYKEEWRSELTSFRRNLNSIQQQLSDTSLKPLYWAIQLDL